MSEVTRYDNGVPSWIDVMTTDFEGGKAFYGKLFGWEFEDQGEETGHYHLCKLRGKDVAGLGQQNADMQAMGVPVAWTTYFATDDVDATAKKVVAAGGSIMVEPMDVMDSGRMVVVADRTGGVFGIWQARNHIGAELVNEPGTLCWNQLNTRDPKTAISFYAEVFGFTIGGQEGYREFVLPGDRHVAGCMPMGDQFPAEVPAHWLTYFAVADTEATVAQAQELGASVMAPPMDIDVGRMSILVDPAGAALGVIKLSNPPQ